MTKLRNILYLAAKMLGDINAIQKGTIGKRLERRIVGRMAGKLLGRIFR